MNRSRINKGGAIVWGEMHINTLGLVRSLGEASYFPIFVIINHNETNTENYIALSKYVSKVFEISSKEEGLRILESLEADNSEERMPIIPMSDKCAEYIDSYYNQLSKRFICPSVNLTQGCLTAFLNKEKMRELADRAGMHTPKSWLVLKEQTVLPEAIIYPCIIKPKESAHGNKDFGIYNNEQELRQGLCNFFKTAECAQIQEFIKKDFEIIINGYSIGQEYRIPTVIKKIRQYPMNNGGFAYGYIIKDYNDNSNLACIDRFLKLLNYSGIFSLEFIVKEGKSYFLEINLRNDATSYLSTKYGHNLPDLWIESYKTGKIQEGKTKNKISFVSNMLRDYGNVSLHQLSFGKWLCDSLRSKADSVISRKDFAPLRHILKRKFRRLSMS